MIPFKVKADEQNEGLFENGIEQYRGQRQN
jgi:hypothetical protein